MKVDIIELVKIKFGERRREDYGDITSLAESIKKEGLIQPIAVAELEGDDEFPFILVAGGRRFKAMTSLEMLTTPVRIYPPLKNDAELRSLELAENYHREDLTWDAQVKLKREIHEAQLAIHGEKISTKPDATGWTNENTANLLGVSKESIQKDVQLARAVDSAPEFFSECKTKSDATKVLKKLGESMIRAEMTKRAKLIPVSESKTSLLASYVLGSCFDHMDKFDGNNFQICEVDPPYGIDLKKAKRSEGETLEAYNEVEASIYPEFLDKVLSSAYRCMADHSWLIFWFAPEPHFELVHQSILKAGFTTNRMCGIWTKPSGQTKRPETNLANAYEMFFLARKGKPALNKPGRSNVFDFATVPAQKKIHPTERPVELISEILTTLSPAGSNVLVPFLGSGATLLAAHSLGMSATGAELAKEYRDRFILKVHKLGEI